MLVIVPNHLRDQINAAIDKALDGRPCIAAERESIFNTVLDHFNQHGVIPEFDLKAKP